MCLEVRWTQAMMQIGGARAAAEGQCRGWLHWGWWHAAGGAVQAMVCLCLRVARQLQEQGMQRQQQVMRSLYPQGRQRL